MVGTNIYNFAKYFRPYSTSMTKDDYQKLKRAKICISKGECHSENNLQKLVLTVTCYGPHLSNKKNEFFITEAPYVI